MPKPRSEVTLADTMVRVIDQLIEKGKTRIHINQEADGDRDLAHRMLSSAAVTADVDIEIKDFDLAVAATVVEPDDAE